MDLETRLDGKSKLCIQARVVLILPDDTSILPVSCQWGATRHYEADSFLSDRLRYTSGPPVHNHIQGNFYTGPSTHL